MEDLINEREKARKNKDFEKADKIRNDLEEMNILIEDTKTGTKWKKMIKNPFSIISIFLIRFYRYFLSPYLGNNCRFIPSCSEYAIDSFNNYGFLKAFFNK